MDRRINMTNSITIKQYVRDPLVKNRIKELLKDRASQFVVSLLSAVNSSEALIKCDPKSVLNAAMTAASLDLPINQNLGLAYIIPYNARVKKTDEKGKEIILYEKQAQFQLGYRAYIQLSQRSGQVKTINATDVRKGEIIQIDRLTGEIEFAWITENRLKTPVIGYVAFFELNNGFRKSLYMTVEELKAHGMRFSQTMKRGYGLWKDDFDAMCSKTVVKLLLSKYAPLNTQLQTAILADQSVIKGEGEYEYVDNQPELAEDIAEEKEKERLKRHIEVSEDITILKAYKEYCVTEELKKIYNDKLKKLSVKK